MSNYPPGVTGDEFAIAGPDYEIEMDGDCPDCDLEALMEFGFKGKRWVVCQHCRAQYDLAAPERDPDEAYHARIEDRMEDDRDRDREMH